MEHPSPEEADTKKPTKLSRRIAWLLGSVAVVATLMTLAGALTGYFGGDPATKSHPYQWYATGEIVFVGSGSCTVSYEDGHTATLELEPTGIFGLKLASHNPPGIMSGSAQVVCQDGKVFTGPQAFLVEYHGTLICPALLFLVFAPLPVLRHYVKIR